MFKCVVLLAVPLKPKGQQLASPTFWPVAEYDYEPNLQVGDQVQITKWEIGTWDDEPLTFIAGVTRRVKEILPEKPKDVFKISFYLEIADKEQLPRIVGIFKKLNPGKFEDELY